MKPKLIRITTVPLSLNVLIKGQLRYMSEYFEVVAVSSGPKEGLIEVKKREGVPIFQAEMTRAITPLKDLKAVWQLYKLFKKEKSAIVYTHTPKAGMLVVQFKTALAMLGKLHYLELASKKMILFGYANEKLPSWLLNYAWQVNLDYLSSSFLPGNLGLVEKEI